MESSPRFLGCPRSLLSVLDLPMFSCWNHLKRNPAQKMKIKISGALICSFNAYCSKYVISRQQKSAQDVNATSLARQQVYVKFAVCNIFSSIFNLRINVWITLKVSFALLRRKLVSGNSIMVWATYKGYSLHSHHHLVLKMTVKRDVESGLITQITLKRKLLRRGEGVRGRMWNATVSEIAEFQPLVMTCSIFLLCVYNLRIFLKFHPYL